jgi:TolA-binding protein
MDSAPGTPAMDRPAEPRRYWQLPAFLLGLAALYGAYRFVPPPSATGGSDPAGDLAELREALAQKPVDAAAVEPLLRRLAARDVTDTPTNFVLGSGFVALADRSAGENLDYWQSAATAFAHCDAARLDRPADAPLLAYRSALAKAATRTGFPGELLQILIAPPPGEAMGERDRLIAECAMRLTPPDRTLAKNHFAKYLGTERGSSAAAARPKLELARLHRADREAEKARAWLADISAKAPADVLALAKVELGQLALEDGRWSEANEQFESAISSGGLPAADRGAIRFLNGLALYRSGNPTAAVPYFVQAANEPGSIGGAAAMKLAEIRGREPNAPSRGEAADWLEKAVAQAGANGEHLKATELRAVFEEVIKASNAEGDFPSALRAATAYAKVAEGNADRRYRAEIDERWANALLKSNPAGAKPKFLDAANEYAALADGTADPTEKAGYRRRAAFQLQRAGENSKALELISRTVTEKDLPEAALGQAWLDRADLLPGDQTAEIEAALKKAVALSGPAAGAARFKLAVTYVKRGQGLLAKAATVDEKREAESTAKLGRDMLAQLADATTVGDPATQELALFELGRLAMLDRNFPEAEARLRKQLALHPSGEHSDNARLWLASALLAKAQTDTGVALKARTEALVYLKELAKSPDAFLRTWGEIWQANTLLQMGDSAATVPLCKELMVRHAGTLEELVLGKLLVHAYLTLQPADAAEARRVYARMEELFAKLPREAYRSDAEYSYEHWKAELPRLKEMLK